MKRYTSIEEIKKANRDAGRYFFSPSTMRFFNSRVHSDVIDGRYFLTSERAPGDDEPRMFTVRLAHDDGDVTTVGDFMAYATKGEAYRAAQLAALDERRRLAEVDRGSLPMLP